MNQVKFKVLDGTEPTVSMPMLVANGNKVVFRGEDAMLITAKGETAPLTSDGDDWYLNTMSRMSTKLGSECEPGDETTSTVYCARTDQQEGP